MNITINLAPNHLTFANDLTAPCIVSALDPIEQHVLAAATEQLRSSDQRRLQDELRRGT